MSNFHVMVLLFEDLLLLLHHHHHHHHERNQGLGLKTCSFKAQDVLCPSIFV
jgi:hypothetical protein